MGWLRDGAYDHEGWVANVLADGRVSSSMTSGGVIVHELTTEDISHEREVRHYPSSDHIDVVVPWDQVAAWRVTCQCGWTGRKRPAHTDARYGTRNCPEDVEERDFAPAWDAHVAPFVSLAELDELANQLRDIENRIGDTVQLAYARGATWDQVARATRMTKRAAVQRWARFAPDQPGS